MADRLAGTGLRRLRDRWRELALAALVLGGAIGGIVVLVLGDDSGSGIPAVTRERVASTAGATAQPFSPGRACDVYLVPLDTPSEERARRLARALARRAPVRTCTTSSFKIDVTAVDDRRRQLDGVVVADQLAGSFQRAMGVAPATILGVTELDIYSSAFSTDPFDFGSAKSYPGAQGFGVVSTARMGTGEDLFRRLATMGMRYVGFLYFGLPESSSPASALSPSIRTLDDLDLLEPQFSDPPPTTAELSAARKAFRAKK
ncbi:MAG: hypothetical protein ACRDNY_04825 [Gaiellaceae bacterium]